MLKFWLLFCSSFSFLKWTECPDTKVICSIFSIKCGTLYFIRDKWLLTKSSDMSFILHFVTAYGDGIGMIFIFSLKRCNFFTLKNLIQCSVNILVYVWLYVINFILNHEHEHWQLFLIKSYLLFKHIETIVNDFSFLLLGMEIYCVHINTKY